MENKKYFYIVIALVIIIITSLFLIFNINKNDSTKFKKEYESLNLKKKCNNNECLKISINKNNKIKYATAEKIANIINNKESAAVYIGTPDCQYCRSVAEIITEVANETNIDKIYYYKNNTDNDDYSIILNNLDNLFKDNNKIKEPIVLFIIDGKVVSYKIGTIYSHSNPNIHMDKSGKDGLKEVYKYGIDLVIQANKIKEKKGGE